MVIVSVDGRNMESVTHSEAVDILTYAFGDRSSAALKLVLRRDV